MHCMNILQLRWKSKSLQERNKINILMSANYGVFYNPALMHLVN